MNLKIAVSKITWGMQGPDVALVHQAIRALGRDVPIAETEARVFGPGSVAVLKAQQAQFSVLEDGRGRHRQTHGTPSQEMPESMICRVLIS